MSAHPQIKEGTWFDNSGRRRIITQYHEVVGFFLGRKVQVSSTEETCVGLRPSCRMMRHSDVGCVCCHSCDSTALLVRPLLNVQHEGVVWFTTACCAAS